MRRKKHILYTFEIPPKSGAECLTALFDLSYNTAMKGLRRYSVPLGGEQLNKCAG